MTTPPRDPGPARLARVYLCPGQLFASAEPTAVTTIVASCVAVCLRDTATGVGGVCHFQLPRWLGTGARTPSYADVAIQELLERMRALGARPGTIEAKLFGGACLTPHVQRRQKALGDENVEHALEHLHECAIPVSESATGGWRGRKVVFQTGDGRALVKVL
jgi:chemotaxis protein CheD